MIVRADQGGLGALTFEAWAHLCPARTLVVLTDHTTRGRADVNVYTGGVGEVRACRQMPSRQDVDWLLAGSTTVYGAEQWYGGPGTYLLERARSLGVRTVLHAMTEMHSPGVDIADLVLATTVGHGIPGATVLPVPVATGRFTRRVRTGCRTFYHVTSNAMLDRNGTDLVLAACERMTAPCTLLIRGPGERRTEFRGPVEIEWLGHHVGPYWDAWPADVDVLVLPRRYAFLNLPSQEAAAQGIPTIDLDRAPQNTWLPAGGLVPASVQSRGVQMRGGRFDVWTCDPGALAGRMDEFVTSPVLVTALSGLVCEWADRISWGRLLPRYRALLGR